MKHLWAAALVLLAACEVGPDLDVGSNQDKPTWDEFLASTYLEPWEGGVYIVNGDTPIENEKKLREFYDELYSEGELIVHRSGGADAKWNNTQKLNLTYCISDTFGSRKSATVTAMASAAAMWEDAANVNFIYDSSQDSNCTASNSAVVFDVRPTSGAGYLARAFFPNNSRSSRNVIIDTSAYSTSWPLDRILGHELGHALGFRHEHTRPESGQCYEDSSWRALTPYDSASIMHYPQCGGTGPALTMSAYDRAGAEDLYGPPDGGGDDPPDDDPPGDDPPGGGTPQSGSASGTLARGQTHYYEGIPVVPGSMFKAWTTGTGDADLYVRFGAQPTLYSFDCRPYLNGSYETCELDVPSDESVVYLMVRGYRAATYTLSATWMAP